MHRILAADIGGTNSRFAAFETDSDGCLSLRQSCWLPTEKADSFTLSLIHISEPTRPSP